MGSLLAAWVSSGQFRPLAQILAELPPAQRDKLCRDVSAVLAGCFFYCCANWSHTADLYNAAGPPSSTNDNVFQSSWQANVQSVCSVASPPTFLDTTVYTGAPLTKLRPQAIILHTHTLAHNTAKNHQECGEQCRGRTEAQTFS